MFCPNCGTKNDDSAQKCSQCGFDQKPKGPGPKHKGTVMMTGSPVANLGAEKPKPSMPNLKGTMVGVAPPDLSGTLAASAKPAASSTAKAAPNLKGTMVGVAPPGIEDLKKQAAASRAAQGVPVAVASAAPVASAPAAPVASAPAAPTAAAKPSAALKGTMIGLAPPNMGAEIEEAKAKLAAQKAQAAAAKAAAQEAPTAPQSGAATGSAAPAGSAAAKGPPSQLKGTMIGVAPPDMQAQITAAREAATAKRAEAAQTEPPAVEKEPPSEPDPLGGTMVGMSPFAPGGPHAQAAAAASALDFNDDTPPAGSGTPMTSPQAFAQSQALREEPAMQAPAVPVDLRPEPSPAYSAPTYSGQDAPAALPIKKSSTGPVLLVVVLLLIVAAGIGFLVMGKGEPKDDKTSDALGSDSSKPAADAPKD